MQKQELKSNVNAAAVQHWEGVKAKKVECKRVRGEQSDGGTYTASVAAPRSVAGVVPASSAGIGSAGGSGGVTGSGYGKGLRRGRSASAAAAMAAGAGTVVGTAGAGAGAGEWSIIEATALAARTARVSAVEIADSVTSVESEEESHHGQAASNDEDVIMTTEEAGNVDISGGGGEWGFIESAHNAGGVETMGPVASMGTEKSVLSEVSDNGDVDMTSDEPLNPGVGQRTREWSFLDVPRPAGGIEIADSAGSAESQCSTTTIHAVELPRVATTPASAANATHPTPNPDPASNNKNHAMTMEDPFLESAVNAILAEAFYGAAVSQVGRDMESGSSDDDDEDIQMGDPYTAGGAPPMPVVVRQAVKAAEITGILYAVKVVHTAESGATRTSVSSPATTTQEAPIETADAPDAASSVGDVMVAESVFSTAIEDTFSDPATTSDEQPLTPFPTCHSNGGSTYEDDSNSDASRTLTPTHMPPRPTNSTGDETRPVSPATMKRSIIVHHMIDLNNEFDELEREFHACVRGGEMARALRVRERMGGIVVCMNGARMALALESWI